MSCYKWLNVILWHRNDLWLVSIALVCWCNNVIKDSLYTVLRHTLWVLRLKIDSFQFLAVGYSQTGGVQWIILQKNSSFKRFFRELRKQFFSAAGPFHYKPTQQPQKRQKKIPKSSSVKGFLKWKIIKFHFLLRLNYRIINFNQEIIDYFCFIISLTMMSN